MRWPGRIAANIESNALVQSIDIVATAFDLGNADIPAAYELDGKSLAPLFGGQAPDSWRNHLYIELGFGRAIRTQEYKYIAVRYPNEHLSVIRNSKPENLPKVMAPLNRAGIGTRGSANPNFYYEDALFRIDRDRNERRNLIDDPESRRALEHLRSLLAQTIQLTGRPYGEIIPGGNATAPGQVEAQQTLVRKMKIQGKKVSLPE